MHLYAEVSVAREKCINLLDLGATIKAYVEKIRIMSLLIIHLRIKSTQRNIRNVFLMSICVFDSP
jgi:hypothetical protein